MLITERLDKFMLEHDYTKADVAKFSGIPYTTIVGLYQKGDENIKLSTLKKIASFVGCSLDELAGYSSPSTTKNNQIPENLKEIVDNTKFTKFPKVFAQLSLCEKEDVKNLIKKSLIKYLTLFFIANKKSKAAFPKDLAVEFLDDNNIKVFISYMILDDFDRGNISGRIESLLESKKYRKNILTLTLENDMNSIGYTVGKTGSD